MGASTSAQRAAETSEGENLLWQEAMMKAIREAGPAQAKILLLGPGGSGKSTVLKQIRLMHGMPFSVVELERCRQLVFENLMHGIMALLESMEDMGLSLSEENKHYREVIKIAARCTLSGGKPFPVECLGPLHALWADADVQMAWRRGHKAAIPDNLGYLFSALDRLFNPEYHPVKQDVLQCYKQTTMIEEYMFKLPHRDVVVIDVGGQTSERRRWIHCFKDVTAIMFVVSLSSYDQYLAEDKQMNQMDDALAVWDSICSASISKNTFLILLLNKNDLFERKIPQSPIKNFFPDYDAEAEDIQAGRDYFKQRFTSLAQKAGRLERGTYIHLTTATETASLRVVLAAIEE